jgi:hypothetical protein
MYVLPLVIFELSSANRWRIRRNWLDRWIFPVKYKAKYQCFMKLSGGVYILHISPAWKTVLVRRAQSSARIFPT